MTTLNATFYSENLMRKISYSAVIPSGNLENGEKLSTLYLLHGWSGDQSDWLNMGHIEQLAEEYKVAVILPSGENSFYADHPTGMKYGKLFGEEFINETRKLFPLSTDKKETWIAGLSMGGYGALRNGFSYTDTFGKVASLSARILKKDDSYHDLSQDFPDHQIMLRSIIGSDRFEDLPEAMDIYSLINKAEVLPELFIACGTEDYLYRENKDLHTFLKDKNISHDYYEEKANHNWTFWNKYIVKVLDWLTEKN